jgi:hypothetical protein
VVVPAQAAMNEMKNEPTPTTRQQERSEAQGESELPRVAKGQVVVPAQAAMNAKKNEPAPTTRQQERSEAQGDPKREGDVPEGLLNRDHLITEQGSADWEYKTEPSWKHRDAQLDRELGEAIQTSEKVKE